VHPLTGQLDDLTPHAGPNIKSGNLKYAAERKSRQALTDTARVVLRVAVKRGGGGDDGSAGSGGGGGAPRVVGVSVVGTADRLGRFLAPADFQFASARPFPQPTPQATLEAAAHAASPPSHAVANAGGGGGGGGGATGGCVAVDPVAAAEALLAAAQAHVEPVLTNVPFRCAATRPPAHRAKSKHVRTRKLTTRAAHTRVRTCNLRSMPRTFSAGEDSYSWQAIGAADILFIRLCRARYCSTFCCGGGGGGGCCFYSTLCCCVANRFDGPVSSLGSSMDTSVQHKYLYQEPAPFVNYKESAKVSVESNIVPFRTTVACPTEPPLGFLTRRRRGTQVRSFPSSFFFFSPLFTLRAPLSTTFQRCFTLGRLHDGQLFFPSLLPVFSVVDGSFFFFFFFIFPCSFINMRESCVGACVLSLLRVTLL